MKKLCILIILALICATLIPVCAFALGEDAFNNPTYSQTLGNGISYKEATYKIGSYNQKLYYGEYKPTANSEFEWVIHSKSSLATVMDIAKDFEATTGRKVYLAVNGDYFSGNSPVESYVTNGVVRNKGAYTYKHCFGFDNNGKVVVGRMTETKYRLDITSANGTTKSFYTDKLNTAPESENGIGIYTNPGTFTVANAQKYKINLSDGETSTNPVIGESRRMSDSGINDDTFEIKSAQFWVVAKGEAATYCYNNIVYGTKVSYTETPAGDFDGCSWIVGGYDILVNNFVANENCHTDNAGSSNAPRTLLGAKEDGTMFVCVDYGSSYGTSITVNREAQLAKGLGAKYALELDGGGSSTMVIRVDDALTLRTQTTDPGVTMRRVAQAVMIVEKEKPANSGNNENPGNNGDNNPSTEPGNNNQSGSQTENGNQSAVGNESGNQTGDQVSNNNNTGANTQKPSNNKDKTTIIIIACVAGAVAVIVAVTAIVIIKRKGEKGE